MFGEGICGQLGVGKPLYSRFPRRVPAPLNAEFVDVGAGDTTSYAVTSPSLQTFASPACLHRRAHALLPPSHPARVPALEVNVYKDMESVYETNLAAVRHDLERMDRLVTTFPENRLYRLLQREIQHEKVLAERQLGILRFLQATTLKRESHGVT